MRSFLPIIILLCLLFCAEAAAQNQQPFFLQQGQQAVLVEFPSQALPVWAKHQSTKPTLLLFSRDPFLQALPTALTNQSRKLLGSPALDQHTHRLSPQVTDPLLLPRMTLRAAIEADMFSSIVWVFPSRTSTDRFDLKLFRQQLLESGAATNEEAQSFSQQTNGFSGMVGNTPLRAIPPDLLDGINAPTLLHIDLGYFTPLYKGEIKTPLYPLLYDFLKSLRQQKLNILALTISLSNLDSNLPLTTRFIGRTLAQLIAEPQRLEQPLPESWELRRNALYLGNFMQTEKIHQLYRKMLSSNPEDASANYALYLNLRQLKKGSEALSTLTKAATLDPVYGLEYLQLVPTALDKGQPLEALKMFTLAEAAFPNNPFIPLQKAQLLIDLGQRQPALELLKKLREENWSEVYYPEMRQYLEKQLSSD